MNVWEVADKGKNRLTASTKHKIQRIYQDAYMEVLIGANLVNSSNAMAYYKLRQLEKQLLNKTNEIYALIEKEIGLSAKEAAKLPCKAIDNLIKECGFNMKGAFSYVPDNIVRKLEAGQIYNNKWTLSSSIWKMNQNTQQQIQDIIAKGLINGLPIEDIADSLEGYVLPNAKKPWNLPFKIEKDQEFSGAKLNKETGKYEKRVLLYKGRVDYNAQRLARTMIQHSYQMSLVETQKDSPWQHGIMWHSANSSRVCAICQERDGEIYDIEDLPFDHPNGMCYFTVVQDDLTDIAGDLSDWVDGYGSQEVSEYMFEAYGL